ncbi:MAG: hypothetical protein HY791_01170 [Deltaproteobacteria bacterium]|nr:hypothetical protein [Deltaproteobacteria bacterium]
MSASSITRAPIEPELVRRIGTGGFAFVPNRFLRDGFLASLEPDELRLYVLLVLAGDRQGMSFYHYDRLCAILRLSLEAYLDARNALIQKRLLAFDGTRFQVLELPPRPQFSQQPPLRTSDDLLRRDPATIRRAILDGLALDPDDSSED